MNEALRAYFPVADMIAATFGPCCEAAIHDFSQPETSVVHVAGQVTGRKVGQSFDHLIKNVLLSKDFQNDHKRLPPVKVDGFPPTNIITPPI
mgnify:FL=1